MSIPNMLHQLLTATSSRTPDQTAVVFRERSLSYAALDAVTNQLASVLRTGGVVKGDRVGIYVSKSLASVVSVFAILKAGACYVPLDPRSPTLRLAYMIRDSGITALLTSSMKVTTIQTIFPDNCPLNTIVLVDIDQPREDWSTAPRMPTGMAAVPWNNVITQPTTPLTKNAATETDLAYILYTSGSTGVPKGVMISHRNSLNFVNWATECVGLTSDDHVANHAPLHFGLSTFDIFASCKVGATIILVPENASTLPAELVKLIERERISVWYSVPSVLTLMALYGNLTSHDLSCLRTIIFVGEVFPTKYLRRLMNALPQARYMNWYGTTEINVCTSYEIPQLNPERTTPIPIGKSCANLEVFAVNSAGNKVTKPGELGELYVSGPSLMQGYLGQPEQTTKVLIPNRFTQSSDQLMYKTGDIVTLDADGNYLYVGREDRMIKTRGYRVELGEIEAVLSGHPAIREVAVLAIPDQLLGNRLCAVISILEDATLTREDVLTYCNQRLPRYMLPDVVEFCETIQKTSTGKIDRASLAKRFCHA